MIGITTIRSMADANQAKLVGGTDSVGGLQKRRVSASKYWFDLVRT